MPSASLLIAAALANPTPAAVAAPPPGEAVLRCAFDPAAADDRAVLAGALEAVDDGAAAASPSAAAAPKEPPPFGAPKSWRVDFHAGVGIDFANTEDVEVLTGVGFSYFVAEGLSLDVEVNGLYASQEGENAQALNACLLFRWHFALHETWSLFLDAGAGVQYATDDIPADGTRFDFTPQAGLGATRDIGGGARLVVGVRWRHESNANVFDHNPGRDSLYVYTGLSFPF